MYFPDKMFIRKFLKKQVIKKKYISFVKLVRIMIPTTHSYFDTDETPSSKSEVKLYRSNYTLTISNDYTER